MKELYAELVKEKITEKYNSVVVASNDLTSRTGARYYDKDGNYIENYRYDAGAWKTDTDNAVASIRTLSAETKRLLDEYNRYGDAAFSAEINQKLGDIDTSITSMVKHAADDYDFYSGFETEDDYNKYIREKGYYQKHYGKSYDEIQKEYQNAAADPARAEEATWLKHYGVNYGYGDEDYYNAAIAALQPMADAAYFEDAKRASEHAGDSPAGYVGHLIGSAISDKIKEDPDSAKTQYEQIQAARTRFEQENVYELQYADLQNNEDFETISQKRAFANPTAEDFDEWYNRQNGGLTSLYDENGNWYSVDAYGDVLDENYEANYKPQVADKLGLYLAASDEDKERVLSSMSLDTDLYLQYLNEGRLGDWDNLKPEEISTYYYLMNTEGQESAYKFLDNMKTELNHRTVEAAQAHIASAEGLELAFYNAASVPANVFGGVVGAVDDALNVLQGKRINPYSTAHSMTNFASAVREETAKDIAEATEGVELFGQNIPEFLYQTTMSVADSALGVATLGGGYTVFMGMTSASNEAKRLYELGASDAQIVAGSVMAGAAEAVFEKISIDRLLSEKNIAAPIDLVVDILKQAGVETSEEIFTELANTLTNSLVMAGNSDLNNAIAQYEQEGMTEEEAIKQALIDKAVDVGYAAFGGFLSGAGMGGAVSGANYATRNVRTGAAINKTEGAGELVAQTVMDNREGYGNKLYALAQKVASSENKSGRRYDRAVGKLYNQAENALIKNGDASGTKSLIKDRLVELGLSESDAETASNGLFKNFVGRATNRAETKLFKSNSAVQQVWKELNDPANTREAQTRTKEEQLMAAFNPTSALNAKVSRAYETPTQTELYRNATERLDTAQQSLRGAAAGDAETATRFARKRAAETATVKETGEDVSVNTQKLIASIDGDQVQIHTADGVKNIDEVDLSEDIQDIIDKGKRNGMNAEEINAMVAAYDGAEYGEIYAAAYTDLYNEARLGTTRSAALENAKFSIRQKTANAAFDAGSARRMASLARLSQEKEKATQKAKSKNGGKIAVREGEVIFNAKPQTDTQEQFAKLADVFAKSAGVDVVLYTYETNPIMRGKSGKHVVYKNGRCEIWINLEAQNNRDGKWMLSTMAHELTHFMQKNAPREFEVYKNFVIKQVGEARYNEVKARHITSENPSQEDIETADAEAVAELSEGMLADGSAIRELAKTDLDTVQKIVEWICDFLQKVLDAFDGYTGRHQALINDAKADLKAWQKMYNDLLKTSVEYYNAGLDGKSTDGGVSIERYSIDPAFEAAYDRWDKSDPRIVFTIGTTSKALQSLGVPNKNISWDSAKIIKIKNKHPEMTDEIIKQVPYILENPIVVMQSKQNNTRMTMFGEVYVGNKPILAVLELQPYKKGVQLDELKIASAYGKDKAQTFIDSSIVLYKDANKKRVSSWEKRTRLQLPVGSSITYSNNKVPQNDTVVNSNSIPVKENYSLTDEKLIDGYSIKDYNNRGWAMSLLHQEDIMLLNEKIKEAFIDKKDWFGTLSDGTYIFEVNNKLLYVSGTFKNPVIESVLYINADSVADVEIAKGLLNRERNYKKRTKNSISGFLETLEERVGPGFIRVYSRKDYTVSSSDSQDRWRATPPEDFGSLGYYRDYQNRWGDLQGVGEENEQFSDEVLTDEEILSDEFLQTAQDAEERTALLAYRKAIQKTAAARAELAEVKQQIKDAYFSKGPRDQKWKDRMENLKARQAKLERDVDRAFKALLKAEEARPLQELMQREIQKASGRKAKQGMERLQKSRESRNKALARRKIQKTLNELNHLLTHGTKKKNVKEELRETVASALALGELLFNDEISNEDIVRAGVLSVTEKESKLLNEYMDLLEKRDRLQKGIQSMLDHPNPKYKDDLLARESDLEKIKARISRLNGRLSEVFERERNRYNQAQIKEVIGELADAYGKLKGKEDQGDDGGKKNKKERPAYITAAYSQYAYDRLVALKSSLDGTTVKDMSLPQLQEVSDAFTMVRTLLRKADELFQNGRSVEEAGRSVMREVQRFKKDRKTLPAMIENALMRGNQFGWRNMKPVYAFDRIGSETLKDLYWALIEGEGVYYKDIDHAEKFIQAKKKQYHYTDWDLKRARSFKLQSGETIKLNILQMMSIHAYAKREQAHAHMFEGGFMFVEGETYKEQSEWFEKNQSTAKKYKMDPEALMEIERALTEDQKAYADEMQQYLSEVMGAKGNEVSRQLYGIDLFKEEHYFPLKSQKDFVSSVNEALQRTETHLSLRNAGMTKETVPGAENSIVLRSFEDVWIDHVAQMSQYHAMVLPIDNLARIFNYQDEGGSVKNIIHDVFGRHAENYIDQYLLDLNGGVVGGKSQGGVGEKMFGKFKKAQVAASLSTAIQQPTAILRAMSMIDSHYFVAFLNSDQAKTEKGFKNIYDEMLEYAPIAGIKEMGGFDIGSSNQAKQYLGVTRRDGFVDGVKGFLKDSDYRKVKIDELSMWLATMGDKAGWVAIWGAVKREIAAKGVYAVGSKDFLEACGKRFTEVIVYTQVYDSVNSRSEAMRSGSFFDKMTTAFMGEPTTSMNMMFNAVLQWTRAPAGQRAAVAAQSARTIGFTVASTLLAEAAASFIYGLRDDDEEDKWEAWLKRLNRDVFSVPEFMLMVPKMLPCVRDLISILQGFQVERSDLTLFADVVDAYKALWKEDISTYRKIEDLGGSLAACFGLPLRNVMRELRGLYNLAVDLFDQSMSVPTASTFELSNAAENKQQINAMLEAGAEVSIKNLEKKIAEGYRAPMSTAEKTAEAQKTARSNLKASFTRYYKEEYFSAFQAADGKRMKEIAKILAATGLYDSVDETLKEWRKEWYKIN